MTVNPLNHLRREPVLLLLLALSAGCAVVAALAARDSVTALIGALLVVAYWAIERLAMRVGRRGSFQWAMAVALVGTALRLAIVVGGLVKLAVERRAADFQPACDLGHLSAIMRDREADDLALQLFERPHFAGVGQHQAIAAIAQELGLGRGGMGRIESAHRGSDFADALRQRYSLARGDEVQRRQDRNAFME